MFCVFVENDQLDGSYLKSSYYFPPPPDLKQARFLLEGKDVSSLDPVQFADIDDGGMHVWYRYV